MSETDRTRNGRAPMGAKRQAVAPSPWLLLPARLVLFALAQGVIALAAAPSEGGGWAAAARWWPFGIVVVNLATLLLLQMLARTEGRRYRDLLRFDRAALRGHLPSLLAVCLGLTLLAVLPNIGLSLLIFGQPDAGAALLAQPLPPWASLLSLAMFPLTIALVEIPFYFGWIMPKLIATGRPAWEAIAWSALFAAAQHVTMPLLFDAGFMLWRLTMFLPFALALAVSLHRRPEFMVPLMVLHGLLDISVVVLTF